jgi:hypothetical protein
VQSKGQGLEKAQTTTAAAFAMEEAREQRQRHALQGASVVSAASINDELDGIKGSGESCFTYEGSLELIAVVEQAAVENNIYYPSSLRTRAAASTFASATLSNWQQQMNEQPQEVELLKSIAMANPKDTQLATRFVHALMRLEEAKSSYDVAQQPDHGLEDDPETWFGARVGLETEDDYRRVENQIATQVMRLMVLCFILPLLMLILLRLLSLPAK